MTTTVTLSSELECSAEQAWEHLGTSALLRHIASPLVLFRPTKATPFPERWAEGEYRALMFLFGFIPLGWQAIRISFPDPEGQKRFVRDNGYGPLIKRWDHWIEIEPHGDRTSYRDIVHVDAGILTPIVAGFARLFYAHRQSRWRKLACDNFAALGS